MSSSEALPPDQPLHISHDGQEIERDGDAGHQYYYRPGEVLIDASKLRAVQAKLPTRTDSVKATGSGARAEQRRGKREARSAFGVEVYSFDPSEDVPSVVEGVGHKDIVDFNYVTAPAPMRSHAVSYAEPAHIADVERLDSDPRVVRVGVLDTGRPRYSDEFRDYYMHRFVPRAVGPSGTDVDQPRQNPLELLDPVFISKETLEKERAATQASSGGGIHGHYDDVDTMVTSFGRLAHPHAGHGLFVSSIIARYAPGVEIVAEATMSSDAIGDLFDMLVDIDHAVKSGCRVLNMSMGFHTVDDGCPAFLKNALDSMSSAVLVASAGNDGTERKMWPAAHDSVIAVAAVNAAGEAMDWSSYGPWVNACALGDEVTSDYVYASWDNPDQSEKRFNGAARWSGTSFAAPLVTALLARKVAEQGDKPVKDAWYSLLVEQGHNPDGPKPAHGFYLTPPPK